jgi:hypothetical protein
VLLDKSLAGNTLRRVMLGGKVVFEDGKFLAGAGGELFLR